MSKKNPLSDEERQLFQDAMRGVERLITTKILPLEKKPGKKPKNLVNYEEKARHFTFSDYEKLDAVTSEERLEYFKPGLQHKIIRKFRKGQYNVQGIVDLHGMTVDQARDKIEQFLTECKINKISHLLIIHGKGRPHQTPILKNRLNQWLRQSDEVLAFCSAAAKDGHTGALYVMLRR